MIISPNLNAFLDMVRWSEIGADIIAGSDQGYNVLVGSTPKHILTFPSYATHPNIKNEKLNSTAAGAFQINHPTWLDIAPKIGVTDFTPPSQRLIAIEKIREAHAIATIEAGDISTAIGQCSHIWASLAGSPYGQHMNTMADLQNAFTGSGGILTS